MDMSDNFTVQQLAKHLQVHENTIYEWLDQGTIFPHAFKIKRGWRIPCLDVERAKKREFVPIEKKKPTPVRPKPAGGFVTRW